MPSKWLNFKKFFSTPKHLVNGNGYLPILELLSVIWKMETFLFNWCFRFKLHFFLKKEKKLAKQICDPRKGVSSYIYIDRSILV